MCTLCVPKCVAPIQTFYPFVHFFYRVQIDTMYLKWSKTLKGVILPTCLTVYDYACNLQQWVYIKNSLHRYELSESQPSGMIISIDDVPV